MTSRQKKNTKARKRLTRELERRERSTSKNIAELTASLAKSEAESAQWEEGAQEALLLAQKAVRRQTEIANELAAITAAAE